MIFSPADYEELDREKKIVNTYPSYSKFPLIIRSCGDKAQTLHSAVVVMSPASFQTTHLNLSDNLKLLFSTAFSVAI